MFGRTAVPEAGVTHCYRTGRGSQVYLTWIFRERIVGKLGLVTIVTALLTRRHITIWKEGGAVWPAMWRDRFRASAGPSI